MIICNEKRGKSRIYLKRGRVSDGSDDTEPNINHDGKRLRTPIEREHTNERWKRFLAIIVARKKGFSVFPIFDGFGGSHIDGCQTSPSNKVFRGWGMLWGYADSIFLDQGSTPTLPSQRTDPWVWVLRHTRLRDAWATKVEVWRMSSGGRRRRVAPEGRESQRANGHSQRSRRFHSSKGPHPMGLNRITKI